MDWEDAYTIARFATASETGGGGNLPNTLVDAKSVTKDEQKLARELASRIRILHPDAMVIRQDLSVTSFQEYWIRTTHISHAGEVPLCIVNPTELNRESLTQLLDSECYRRDYQHVLGLNGLGRADPKSRRYDEAVQRLRGHMDDVIDKAKLLVELVHESYPPPLRKLEALTDSYQKQREIRESGSKWFKKRRLNKEQRRVEETADSVMRHIEDGCAPDLSDHDRDKIERFLREQLAQLPLPMLKIMEDRDAQVWAADMLTYEKSGIFLGSLDRRLGVISTLFDEPKVLFEEVFHFVDCLVMQGSQSQKFQHMLTSEPDAYYAESKAGKAFVDEAIATLVIGKTGVFDEHGYYAKKHDGELISAEFMVNLAHLDQVLLTPINRVRIGALLHKHFPENFPENTAYQGNSMKELMDEICPKTWRHYEMLCDAMQQEAGRIDAERTKHVDASGSRSA